jgi:hypothetical protein
MSLSLISHLIPLHRTYEVTCEHVHKSVDTEKENSLSSFQTSYRPRHRTVVAGAYFYVSLRK